MRMHRYTRTMLLYLTAGPVWYAFMWSFFVLSGAQGILADPARQSGKFLRVFTEYAPLPRMVADGSILWKGFFVCGLLAARAFLYISKRQKGGWVGRGLAFGMLHWALMTPWFEFYLPYNAMHEPLRLVVFEAFLWLCTLLCLGVYMAALMYAGTHPQYVIDHEKTDTI